MSNKINLKQKCRFINCDRYSNNATNANCTMYGVNDRNYPDVSECPVKPMLDSLIKSVIVLERAYPISFKKNLKEKIDIIERATGQKIEELI